MARRVLINHCYLRERISLDYLLIARIRVMLPPVRTYLYNLRRRTLIPRRTHTGWDLWAAAMATDNNVRNDIISLVRARAASNSSAGAFPLVYDVGTGAASSGFARYVSVNRRNRMLSISRLMNIQVLRKARYLRLSRLP